MSSDLIPSNGISMLLETAHLVALLPATLRMVFHSCRFSSSLLINGYLNMPLDIRLSTRCFNRPDRSAKCFCLHHVPRSPDSSVDHLHLIRTYQLLTPSKALNHSCTSEYPTRHTIFRCLDRGVVVWYGETVSCDLF